MDLAIVIVGTPAEEDLLGLEGGSLEGGAKA